MTPLLLLPLLAIATAAQALDASHTGTYSVIRRDGGDAGLVSYLWQTDGIWHMEQRNDNGSWKNLTCDVGCELRDSLPSDIAGWFPAGLRDKYRFDCIQNKAYAFCAYRSRVNPQQSGHMLVGLVVTPPQPIMLKKISGERQELYLPGPLPPSDIIARYIASKECAQLYSNKYWNYRPNKAFASSPDGACGYSAAEMSTPEAASASALRFCEQSRVKGGQIARCTVVDINGAWQAQ